MRAFFSKIKHWGDSPNKRGSDEDPQGSSSQKAQQQQQQQGAVASFSQSGTTNSDKQTDAKSKGSDATGNTSGKSPKAPKFSFPSNTVKPDMPSDPENTSFTVTDPEVWVHRPLDEDEDDGIVHVCFFFSPNPHFLSCVSQTYCCFHKNVQMRPVRYSTRQIMDTYKQLNPRFVFKPKYTPPRRVLTNPSIPRHNEGYDNENYDLIMHVGDVLGSDTAGEQGALAWRKGSRYTLIDVLGHGTFGQVIKCRDETTNKLVAMKVLKNKPAYFKQGLLEIAILAVMNTNADPTGERRTLRFYDHFLYRNHLCLVNELLGMNLYEVVKKNGYKGLPVPLIRTYTRQILDALIALDEARIVHCDLKPENVLLDRHSSTDITLIDFGSACFESSTMYSYIQSRHYRSPEVILGLRYTCAIDMWSLGCIAAELFLGIPIFPGANEYNQMYKIIEMLGPPPPEMIRLGTRASKFFKPDSRSAAGYLFKSISEYEAATGVHVDHDKKYFVYRNLQELVSKFPMKNPDAANPAKSANPACQDKEVRRSLLHFLRGCLQLDPTKRWTPDQARAHPFLNEEVLPDGWAPPPPRRPTPENAPPRPKEAGAAAAARAHFEPSEYYSRFCAAMRSHRIIDVAAGTTLAELAETLNPPPTDKTVPVPVATRGNRAASLCAPPLPAPGPGPASPPAAASSLASPCRLPVGARPGVPGSAGAPGSALACAGRGGDDEQQHISASANVESAAELRARIAASIAAAEKDPSGRRLSSGDHRKRSHKPKRLPGVQLAEDTTSVAAAASVPEDGAMPSDVGMDDGEGAAASSATRTTKKATATATATEADTAMGGESTNPAQEEPFDMDGDNTPRGDDTDSDEGGPKSPRRGPDVRAPPYFAALQQQDAPEVPASWSHRPLGPNPGMPRVRPQQPPPMYADVAGSASGSVTGLTFGAPAGAGTDASGSYTGLAGDTGAARSHRSKVHHHRAKDGGVPGLTPGGTTRPRAALSFGSPKLPSSPLASAQEGIAALSLIDESEATANSNSNASANSTTVDVRARPRNLQEDFAALDQDSDSKDMQ